jgi:hypothetical protein
MKLAHSRGGGGRPDAFRDRKFTAYTVHGNIHANSQEPFLATIYLETWNNAITVIQYPEISTYYSVLIIS